MPKINIDLHILKKILFNQKSQNAEIKKCIVHFTKAEEFRNENKALLEFIERECNNIDNNQKKEEQL